MTRAFWLSLTFLGVFALVLGIFVAGGLDQALAGVSGDLAARIVRSFTGAVLTTFVRERSLWIDLHGYPPVPVQAALLNLHLPLYIAVVTAAARSYGRGFWLLLGGGVLVVYGLDTLGLAARIWTHVSEELPAHGLLPLVKAFDASSQKHVAAVPAFIGALLAWNLPGPADGAAEAEGAAPERNESDPPPDRS